MEARAGSRSFGDRLRWIRDGSSIGARVARIVVWVGGLALAILVCDLIGIPIGEWLRQLLRKIAEVPVWAIFAGSILQTAQTSLVALAWLSILRAAWPEPHIRYRIVLACYATAVALNGFVPANLGTFAMLGMFAALIAGATYAATLSGLVVQKIPFSVFNVALYLYLFLSVAGSFSIKLGFLSDHQGVILLSLAGVAVLIALLVRIFWRRTKKLRAELATGGAVLTQPRRMVLGVALPELASYLARLGVIAVFLGAYGIPVTFHNVATVSASNSISNSVSVTPGGVGVNQAMNAAALRQQTSKSTATAYSAAQQLVVSAWNVVFAIVMVSWVFGWKGGRELVESSYGSAKERSRELAEERRKRRQEKRSGRGPEGDGAEGEGPPEPPAPPGGPQVGAPEPPPPPGES
ncbi:MAG: hypothetical protein U0R52_05360 [Solirubrobacterales bacterium]